MDSTRLNNNVTLVLNSATTVWEKTETTKDTFMEQVESFIIFKIGIFISDYWFPVFIPVGLIGNTLSFLVMIKSNNRKMSTCIYMAAISINDNIMMYMAGHDYLVSGLHTHKWHLLECKFLAFLALFALQNCAFLVVAMTMDKYIAIKWPHRAALYSTPQRAKTIAGSVYICACIYNIPHFFLSSVIGGECFNFGISNVFSKVYSWLSFVLNAIFPFTMLIYMNIVIVKAVRKSRKLFRVDERTTAGIDTRQKSMKNVENQLTKMLLLVTTLFLILLFPTYFRFIYMVFVKQDTPLEYAQSMLLFQITTLLYISNSGINFFLYCISGQKFRNDLKELLCCCCQRKTQSQSSSTGVSIIHTEEA